MLIKTLPLGQMETNCYVVTDENTLDCAVIDPGDESNVVLNYLEEHKLKCRYIFITHGHFDHTGAVRAVHEQTGAMVCMNSRDADTPETGGRAEFKYAPPEGTRYYGEGDVFKVGELRFEIMETPGHSPGGVVIKCENALFTGDTLFRDSCGRTDFDGGDMQILLGSLRRIAQLPGEFEVYPGHMDATSLDRERRFNYYMKFAMENR